MYEEMNSIIRGWGNMTKRMAWNQVERNIFTETIMMHHMTGRNMA